MIVPRRPDSLSPFRLVRLTPAGIHRVELVLNCEPLLKRLPITVAFRRGAVPRAEVSLAARLGRGAAGWYASRAVDSTVTPSWPSAFDQRVGSRFAVHSAANSTRAAQQRPEADADLASLDPRCLGLVRWADREGEVFASCRFVLRGVVANRDRDRRRCASAAGSTVR